MSMSKKLYKRITTLHKEGLSRTMTIKLFITMAKNPDDAAEAIEEFFEVIGFKELEEKYLKDYEETLNASTP